MQQLIGGVFHAAFRNPILDRLHDAAVLPPVPGPLALTTDSYVVKPLVFPGGDIGSMSVFGTVNDLAMSGARPLFLTCGFILEEGLPFETLRAIVASMAAAALRCGVQVVTGDTKVVDKGRGDGLFINTAGLGRIEAPAPICPAAVQDGDAILLSGDLGRHGIAVMAQREGIAFETTIQSDSAPVHECVLDLLAEGVHVRCLRDLTRGGLASALNEIAAEARARIVIDETAIPVLEQVHAACELLGLDVLQVANEGRFAAFVEPHDALRALEILRRHPVGAGAACIGHARKASEGVVILRGRLGAERVLDMPSGEQLPRIC
jgi:hydrogenase expression/formation protein HypE